MEDFYLRQAEWLKALAHPVRLCIIQGLMDKGSCNVTDMQECLKLQQSTLSMHLQKLRAAGVITGTRVGLEVNYRLKDPQAARLLELLQQEHKAQEVIEQ